MKSVSSASRRFSGNRSLRKVAPAAWLVLLAGLAVGWAAPANAVAQPAGCGAGYYTNVDGACVHDPEYSAVQPSGATALCGDGTYSFSRHHRGTCSHHDGVAQFLDGDD